MANSPGADGEVFAADDSRSSSAEVAAAWLSKVTSPCCIGITRSQISQRLRVTVQTALQRVSSDGPDNVVPLRRDQL